MPQELDHKKQLSHSQLREREAALYREDPSLKQSHGDGPDTDIDDILEAIDRTLSEQDRTKAEHDLGRHGIDAA